MSQKPEQVASNFAENFIDWNYNNERRNKHSKISVTLLVADNDFQNGQKWCVLTFGDVRKCL